jgi:hypothetical protein
VGALAMRIGEYDPDEDAVMNTQHVATCLFGMQGMNTDVPEVRQVLKALAPRIAACTGDMSSQVEPTKPCITQNCSLMTLENLSCLYWAL